MIYLLYTVFVQFHISSDIPGIEYRLATISGPPDACLRAKAMVEDIVGEVSTYMCVGALSPLVLSLNKEHQIWLMVLYNAHKGCMYIFMHLNSLQGYCTCTLTRMCIHTCSMLLVGGPVQGLFKTLSCTIYLITETDSWRIQASTRTT